MSNSTTCCGASKARLTKGGDRVLPMHKEVAKILIRRLEENPKPPFPSVEIMRRRWKVFKNQVPKWKGTNLHSLRHGFVTRMVLAGHPLAARLLVSHHSQKMTDLYTHAKADDLREALDSA
jgi:integrase